LFSREGTTDVAADGVAKTFAIPEPPAENTTYFLKLQLFRPTGELLSRNFYWLSAMPDTLDFSKTEWYYTPLTSFADFKALQDLPKATVKASLKTQETGEEAGGHVTVENTGTGIAFLVRLRLLKQKGETEILPVFWEDNYFSLMPGEKRDVAVKVRKSDAGDAKLQLAVDGYNVSPVTIYAAQK
jgi:exo-1,4-beta-D-glucosaminidase